MPSASSAGPYVCHILVGQVPFAQHESEGTFFITGACRIVFGQMRCHNILGFLASSLSHLQVWCLPLKFFLEVLLQRSVYLQGYLPSRVAAWGIEIICSLEAPSSLSWSTFFLENHKSQAESHLSVFRAGVSSPRWDIQHFANIKGRGRDLCCCKNITLAVGLSSMCGCTDMLHGRGQLPFTATP